MHKTGLTAISAFLSATLLFSGCGKTTDTVETSSGRKDIAQVTDEPFYNEPMSLSAIEVTNEDVFETGFGVFQIEFEYGTENEVYFRRYLNFNIDWYLYVFDEELENADLDMLMEMEPVIVNEGEIELKEGQWVYVVCSCNSTCSFAPSNGYFEGSYFGP